ncbi:restriction endonuclease subunit S [Flavobacterium crassostreae]|uniref:Type I restriction endonuclease subunit S n=1 Tax=Flavobacterium crassostreae TaxID=1763534 RepID=A0A1B9DML8_9FLAO|nr:restriction endonuclease subunit S [Flavobacterium crassostreae]OCB70948.1 type I restriction endonuclease subunit S [Flavobacterium crassostreae]
MSYLEKLLEGVEVEWKILGEVAKVGTGSSNGNEADQNGEYPFFVRSQKIKTKDTFEYDEEAIIIPGEGGIGDIYHYINGKYALHQRVYRIHFNIDFVDTRFIYYYMCTNFKRFIMTKAVSATVTSIRKPMIENFPIPIPSPDNPKKSLEIQQKIVGILDSFTELTAELTAELTTRKMQYSYYREKLYSLDKIKVQHLPLGDENIGKFIRGGGLQKKDFTETGVGCIHYGQIYTYYGTYANKTKSFVSEEFAKKARMAKYGDLVIATTSETDEDVCKAVAWLGDKEIAVSSDACFYRHNLNPKYVSYFFQTEQFQKQKRPFITGTKVRRVNADDLAKIKIPVPSKEEQERIVTILDNFDTLTNSISEGLPKEIELRKKQYEYYRDLLLTFPQDNLEL